MTCSSLKPEPRAPGQCLSVSHGARAAQCRMFRTKSRDATGMNVARNTSDVLCGLILNSFSFGFYFYMSECFDYMYLCVPCVYLVCIWYGKKAQEGVGSPGSGIL